METDEAKIQKLLEGHMEIVQEVLEKHGFSSLKELALGNITQDKLRKMLADFDAAYLRSKNNAPVSTDGKGQRDGVPSQGNCPAGAPHSQGEKDGEAKKD